MTASRNGEGFLLNPSAPAGLTRYAHARVVPASSTQNTIYVSGIAAVTPEGECEGVTTNADGTFTIDVREQTAAILRRIDAIIKGASNGQADLYNIVDATVYVTDMASQYQGMNEEWNKIWKDRLNAPSRATVGVRELPDPRFAVEVKVIAVF